MAGEERRLSTDAQNMVSLEDELEVTLVVEGEALLEEAYMADAGVSIEMSTGKNQDLPPSPALGAASSNASRVITVPLPEGV